MSAFPIPPLIWKRVGPELQASSLTAAILPVLSCPQGMTGELGAGGLLATMTARRGRR